MFTEKGIKVKLFFIDLFLLAYHFWVSRNTSSLQNIHIWSYQPSRLEKDEDSVWTCLYDTPGNGTSINQLYFRHNAHGTLQGISKSDDQKLRVWDLLCKQRCFAA